MKQPDPTLLALLRPADRLPRRLHRHTARGAGYRGHCRRLARLRSNTRRHALFPGGPDQPGQREVADPGLGAQFRRCSRRRAPATVEFQSQTSFQVTPILIDDTLYYCSPFNRVFALDAETGAERWSYDPKVDMDCGGRAAELPRCEQLALGSCRLLRASHHHRNP